MADALDLLRILCERGDGRSTGDGRDVGGGGGGGASNEYMIFVNYCYSISVNICSLIYVTGAARPPMTTFTHTKALVISLPGAARFHYHRNQYGTSRITFATKPHTRAPKKSLISVRFVCWAAMYGCARLCVHQVIFVVVVVAQIHGLASRLAACSAYNPRAARRTLRLAQPKKLPSAIRLLGVRTIFACR